MVDALFNHEAKQLLFCRGANRRNRYPENPPNCMGGIREFNCACLIVSLVLALLLNTSHSLHCCVLFAWSLQFFRKVLALRDDLLISKKKCRRYHNNIIWRFFRAELQSDYCKKINFLSPKNHCKNVSIPLSRQLASLYLLPPYRPKKD